MSTVKPQNSRNNETQTTPHYIISIIALCSVAQNVGEAFYVYYRNDGMIQWGEDCLSNYG